MIAVSIELKHTHIHARIHTHTNTHTYIHKCTNTHTHTNICTKTNTHTHTQTNTRTHNWQNGNIYLSYDTLYIYIHIHTDLIKTFHYKDDVTQIWKPKFIIIK